MGPCRAQLPDGRWHFQHGPIDIVLGATGDRDEVGLAHQRAWRRFTTVLEELVSELPDLRCPIGVDCPVSGVIATRMWSACAPFNSGFITPMAAVAGSVAQELASQYDAPGIDRAWVNNGGDIALFLASEQTISVGLYADVDQFDARRLQQGLSVDGKFEVHASSQVRGVATSGWKGRSLSLGIADSVTVLAKTAAEADAAATVIANAVNVADSRIIRLPAVDVKDASDLGLLLVTVSVPPLGSKAVQTALQAGLDCAIVLRNKGLICSAVLVCQNQYVATNTFEIALPAISTTMETAVAQQSVCYEN